MDIYSILGEGANNAMTGKQICFMLGITPRELTQRVKLERKEGKPICAKPGNNRIAGYYIAADQEEMKAYCESLQHRAEELLKTREACKNMIDNLPL